MTNLKKVAHKVNIITVSLVSLVLLCLLLVSCSVQPKFEVEGKKLDFLSMSLDELEKYARIGEYKNTKISLDGRTKQEAIWDSIAQNAQIDEYPQEHVYYYMDQLEGQYRYYAEQAGVSYKEILEQLGKSETSILQDAKSMTKKDLVYAIVVKLEGIELSEGEKQAYFDKYVQKYVSNYGYDKKYVEENMSELIYGSMLYDKTTEFLILNNTFSQ